jgi:hypothetical protein
MKTDKDEEIVGRLCHSLHSFKEHLEVVESETDINREAERLSGLV